MCDAWSMVETQKLPGYETLHSLLFEIFQGKAAWPVILMGESIDFENYIYCPFRERKKHQRNFHLLHVKKLSV